MEKGLKFQEEYYDKENGVSYVKLTFQTFISEKIDIDDYVYLSEKLEEMIKDYMELKK